MHENYMKRCIELAQLGIGYTAPNPMVGSVIVCNNRIIGEGFHRKYGENHAEINAIAAVRDKSLLKKSTIYVNLEPCAHYGKTPPCTEAIIRHGIPKVVIGSVDVFHKVAGKGVLQLRKAGCDVQIGILEAECNELNKRFFTFHTAKRPYIILKWAQTTNGFIDAKRDKDTPIGPIWITNETARTVVHKWRSEEQAIMVGTRTVEKDNPRLNIRNWVGKNPVRIVLDRNLRLARDFAVFDGTQNTAVFTSHKNKAALPDLPGVTYHTIDFDEEIIHQINSVLYAEGIQSVIIEGGARLLQSFIACNQWDEARVFVGNTFFTGGVKAPVLARLPIWQTNYDDSRLCFYRNRTL